MRHKIWLARLLTAALLWGTLAGCGAKVETDPTATPAPTGKTGGEETYEYVPSYQELSEDMDGVCGLANGKLYYTTYGIVAERTPTAQELEEYGSQEWLFSVYGTQIWARDLETGEETQLSAFQPIVGEPKEGTESDGYTNGVCVNADGTFAVLDTLTYYSTTQEDRYEQYTYLRLLDETGAELSRTLLDFVGEGKTIEYPSTFKQDGQGLCYLSDYNNNLVAFDTQGQLAFQLTSSGWLDGMVTLADGRIAAFLYEQKRTLKVVDAQAKAWGESIPLVDNVNHVYRGSGDYLLYFADQNNLYGYRADTGETDTVLNWLDCSITADFVIEILALPSGGLGVVSQNNNSESNNLITLTLTPSSQIPPRQTLTLATFYPSSELSEAVVNFNLKNPAYRVKLVDYSSYSEDEGDLAGITRLNNDLMSGFTPDLLDVNSLNTALYIKKGLLADLTPYLEADPDLSLEELMPCYVRAASVDGKLYQAYASFGITSVAGLSSMVGDESGWTWDDLHALEADHPDTPLFTGYITQSDILTILAVFDMHELIDWQAGTCSFQSPSFLSMLEFAKKFPADYPQDVTDEYTASLNGNQLLTIAHVGGWDMLGQYSCLFGGEVTYVGFPRESGVGAALSNQGGLSLCICEGSKQKDAAWQFVRTLFDQSYQERITRRDGFPTNKAAFEAAKADWIKENIRYDANGNLVSRGAMAWGDSSILELYPATEAQMDEFTAMLEQVTTSYSYDAQVVAIISEEADAYFAGQCTAEAAAAIIQSRISIYVSEQL